jgi:hypothetical protein
MRTFDFLPGMDAQQRERELVAARAAFSAALDAMRMQRPC